MRHAARTPPPPDFGICGLLQLTLFDEQFAKCRTKFRGERSFLQVFRKFFASSLQVFCIKFGALTVLCFLMSWPRNAHFSDVGAKNALGCFFAEGLAGEAVCRGGERGGVKLLEFEDCWRAFS